jgi:hypothetical protein
LPIGLPCGGNASAARKRTNVTGPVECAAAGPSGSRGACNAQDTARVLASVRACVRACVRPSNSAAFGLQRSATSRPPTSRRYTPAATAPDRCHVCKRDLSAFCYCTEPPCDADPTVCFLAVPLLTNAVCMPTVPGMHATGHEPTCDRAACNVRSADSLATQVLNRAKFFMGLVRKREESVGGRCAACRKSPPSLLR